MEAHAPNDDQFRSMEKRIKRFCKDLTADHSKLSKRQKLKLEQQCPPSDFTWEEVIDVLNLSDAQRNSLKTNYQPASIIGCTAAHDLSSISRGLFLLSQALTPEQQLFWAAKAVEEYSTAEHNNITNLSSLYGQNNNLSEDNSTLNENGGDNSCTNKEESNSQNISSVENLWSDSRSEKEPFQTFAKLRWSCLGYHYGKLRMLL